MLRKFSNLPIIGSLLALLMFGIAVSVGFGFELYRFGILIPIGLVVLILWFFVSALKNGSKATKVCLVIGFGMVTAVIGFYTLIYLLGESENRIAQREEEQRRKWNINPRVELLKAAVEAQNKRAAQLKRVK